MNAEEKTGILRKAARSLQRGGFVAEAVDDEGLLPVWWQSQPLCRVTAEGGYKLLAEFNDTVLAGHPTRFGVQFVTWERDFEKAGLCWGHYFEDYGKARQDFATRSGLVTEKQLFSPEQLTEVYRAVHEALDSGYWQVTVPFPIPNEEYDHSMELLKGMGLSVQKLYHVPKYYIQPV